MALNLTCMYFCRVKYDDVGDGMLFVFFLRYYNGHHFIRLAQGVQLVLFTFLA